ncbi:hypothetical protein BVG16_25210 [Paenibacillus selenitireducens]|uniref:Mannose-6-phosphate isomerase type II C-terminal domain-containing protein n=1 Tax=Paenibacillus selenitireducens TaxID=1324314 RepID=A0A1T2X2G2_9BACL|nr:cupin domain-containing protein [Paenibacillus selenitireducens]OPA74054.1 hypothetical protein BVG16_25210 [Paenibacillus selenitireducens]
MVKGLEARVNPMHEEVRAWGRYRVLDMKQEDSGHLVITGKYFLKPRCNIEYQCNRRRSKVWVITFGEGEYIHNEKRRRVRAGDVLQIPPGNRHSIRGITEVEWVEIQAGMGNTEEDEIQLLITWGEIVQQCGGAYLQ